MINLTNEIVKKALNLGATDVIAKGIHSKNQQLRFSNNEIDIAKTWHENFVQVFLVFRKRIVSTEIRNFDNLSKSLEELVHMARISRENPEFGGIADGPFKYSERKSDPDLKNLKDVSDFVIAAINKASEYATTTAGVLLLTKEDISLSTSGGIEAQDERTCIELSIRAFSQKEASGHSVTCSPTLKGFEPEKAGEEAGELSRLARNPVQGDEGVFDIVFAPLIFGSVLSYSMDMVSAFNVLAGRSMYVGRMGEKVASECITLTDTPSGLKQPLFDDEGVPSKVKPVIEKGILKTYLHNTSTAAKMDTESTANAGFVIPKPINIHVKPGNYSKDELIEEVNSGIYLTNTWYTRFQNLQTGDFSTIPRDAIFKIEKGEIVSSLKDIRLSDNMLTLYQSLEGVSKEQKLVRWWAEVETPCISSYMLARKVRITRSRE